MARSVGKTSKGKPIGIEETIVLEKQPLTRTGESRLARLERELEEARQQEATRAAGRLDALLAARDRAVNQIQRWNRIFDENEEKIAEAKRLAGIDSTPTEETLVQDTLFEVGIED